MNHPLRFLPDQIDNLEELIFQEYGRNEWTEKYVDIVLTDWDILETRYSENHHIFLKSIYGENNITVRLPIVEHIKAHYYLYLGFKSTAATPSREMQKISSAVTAFQKGFVEGTKKLQRMTEEEIEEAAAFIAEARRINREKGLGCTHYTNKSTGEIIFSKECPPGFVRGNLHGKKSYRDNEGNVRWFTEGNEPNGWVRGGFIGLKSGARFYWDPILQKKRFTNQPEPHFEPSSGCCVGYKFYRDINTGQYRRFQNDPGPGFVLEQPTTGSIWVHDVDTNQHYLVKDVSELPKNFRLGFSDDRKKLYSGKKFVILKDTRKVIKINPEDFDSEKMEYGSGKIGQKPIINADRTVQRWHKGGPIPEGWSIGWINNMIGYIGAYDSFGNYKFFRTKEDIPDGWKLGSPYKRIWINDGTTSLLIHEHEESQYVGWARGRIHTTDNKHNLGRLRFCNHETGENIIISENDKIPDGFVPGLIRSKPAHNKGAIYFHNPETKEYRTFSQEDEIPSGWVRGTGKKYKRKDHI